MTSDRTKSTKPVFTAKAAGTRSYANDTFTKIHIAIDGQGFRKNAHKSKYPAILKNDAHHMELVNGTTTAPRDFVRKVKKVGEPYGWDKRVQFQIENHPQAAANYAAIEQMLQQENAITFTFLYNGREVGFCQLAEISSKSPSNSDWLKPDGGISKTQAARKFAQESGLHANFRAIEIFKIGLFPEFTGKEIRQNPDDEISYDLEKGLGNYFLPAVLDHIFNEMLCDMVYLDTRDTNPEGTIRFYERLGFDVFHTETLNTDVIQQPIKNVEAPQPQLP